MYQASAQSNPLRLAARQYGLQQGAAGSRVETVHAQEPPISPTLAAGQAAAFGDLDGLKALMASGAVNARTQDEHGTTFLMRAALGGHPDVAKFLIEQAPTEINTVSANGLNAAMIAAGRGQTEVLGALIEHGADIHARSNAGDAALMRAATGGHTQALQLLLSHGANPNVPNNKGMTPLLGSVQAGDTQAVKVLLAAGADVNVADPSTGMTALMKAALSNKSEIAQMLFDAGADVQKPDHDGNTPLAYAMAGLGQDHPAAALKAAIQTGQTQALQTLIELGADPHVKNEQGQSAIHHAAAQGQVEALRVLIAVGADIHAKDNHGLSAFGHALEAPDKAALTMLRDQATLEAQPHERQELTSFQKETIRLLSPGDRGVRISERDHEMVQAGRATRKFQAARNAVKSGSSSGPYHDAATSISNR